MKWDPRSYQVEGVQALLKNPAYGLLWHPGMGKTATVLTALETMKRAGVGPTLVVAPLRVIHEVWRQEALRWDHLRGLTFELLHGPKKLDAAKRPADVYLINYEGLRWLRNSGGWKALKNKPQVLVLDESTAIKNGQSQRFRSLRTLLPMFKRRYILTGTPAPNSLLDLWAQVYCLDGGKSLGRYITHYRSKYFDSSGYGGYTWEIKEGAEAEIYEAVAPLAQHLASLDHLDMPEKIVSPLHVSMPKSAWDTYLELEDELVVQLDDGDITAANAAVLANKLRQLTSGALYLDDGGYAVEHEAKYDAVESFVEDLSGQPAMVVYEFDHEREQLQRRLEDWPALYGKTTVKQTREIVEAWNAGELPGLLVQPGAAGHGLNLQHGPAQHILWTSGSWRLELVEQTIGRLWRQGQKNTVFVHRVIVRETIDEDVWNRVDNKDARQTSLLRYLKKKYDA